MTTSHPDPMWSVQEVSAFLGIPVATLYQWRYRRIGPRASRLGRYLRYDPADVRAWVNSKAA